MATQTRWMWKKLEGEKLLTPTVKICNFHPFVDEYKSKEEAIKILRMLCGEPFCFIKEEPEKWVLCEVTTNYEAWSCSSCGAKAGDDGCDKCHQ